jgi:hypothetical protein
MLIKNNLPKSLIFCKNLQVGVQMLILNNYLLQIYFLNDNIIYHWVDTFLHTFFV